MTADLSPEERAQADRLDAAMGGLPLDSFDKDGNRITAGEAMILHHRGRATDQWYPFVARDYVGGYEVSTVWLMFDHEHFRPDGYDGPLAIFETMIFSVDEDHRHTDFLEVMERYPDMGSALLGHQNVVRMVTETPEVITLMRLDD